MPVAIALVGILLLIAAWQNTLGLLGSTLASDFDQHFIAWLGVVFVLGIVGYMSPTMRNPSRALLALILIAYFISNKGIFAQFQQEISAQPAPAQGAAQQGPVGPAPIQIQGSAAGGPAGGPVGKASSILGGIGGFFGL